MPVWMTVCLHVSGNAHTYAVCVSMWICPCGCVCVCLYVRTRERTDGRTITRMDATWMYKRIWMHGCACAGIGLWSRAQNARLDVRACVDLNVLNAMFNVLKAMLR